MSDNEDHFQPEDGVRRQKVPPRSHRHTDSYYQAIGASENTNNMPETTVSRPRGQVVYLKVSLCILRNFYAYLI